MPISIPIRQTSGNPDQQGESVSPDGHLRPIRRSPRSRRPAPSHHDQVLHPMQVDASCGVCTLQSIRLVYPVRPLDMQLLYRSALCNDAPIKIYNTFPP